MRRSAIYIAAGLACWFLLIGEGEAQRVVGRHPGSIMRAALSADGELLATGDTNGIVRLLDARTGRDDSFDSSVSSGSGLAGVQGGRSVSCWA